MPIRSIKSLPTTAKKLFLTAYQKSISKGNSEKISIDIAMKIIKEKYKKMDDKWVLKRSIHGTTVLARSGLFLKKYNFSSILSSSDKDIDGYSASPELLKRLSEEDLIDDIADIDHLKLEGDNRLHGLYKLIKHKYNDGNLGIKFIVDPTHPKYKVAVGLHNKYKELGLSAEFIKPEIDPETRQVINCERLGWTVTPEPALTKTLFAS